MWEASHYEFFLVSHNVSIYYMIDLVDPYGRHFGLPFRSWHRILVIIILELVLLDHSLLPFVLVYFFIAGRLCTNDVAQQCLRPLSFFGSIIIVFFILDYFSCPRWSSSLVVDLPFSLYSSKTLSFAMVSLTREDSGSSSKLSFCSLEWSTSQVYLHDYKHIIISKTY